MKRKCERDKDEWSEKIEGRESRGETDGDSKEGRLEMGVQGGKSGRVEWTEGRYREGRVGRLGSRV